MRCPKARVVAQPGKTPSVPVPAGVVTPTPDPFTQTIFAVPLYVLFELAILAGARVERRRLKG